MCCTRPGTISTALAGSSTLCSNFSTLVACDVFTLGRWKVLLEFSLVMMMGTPCSPAIDVAPVLLIVYGIVTFRTPIPTYALVR